jgi:hypothetical protein
VPVAVVSTPPPRTAAEQGDHITRVAGRVGCNLLLGFILFKILVIAGLLVFGLWAAWSMGFFE